MESRVNLEYFWKKLQVNQLILVKISINFNLSNNRNNAPCLRFQAIFIWYFTTRRLHGMHVKYINDA